MVSENHPQEDIENKWCRMGHSFLKMKYDNQLRKSLICFFKKIKHQRFHHWILALGLREKLSEILFEYFLLVLFEPKFLYVSLFGPKFLAIFEQARSSRGAPTKKLMIKNYNKSVVHCSQQSERAQVKQLH